MTVFRAVSKAEPIGLRPIITALFDNPTWLRGKSKVQPDVILMRTNARRLSIAIESFVNDSDLKHLFIEVSDTPKKIKKVLNEIRITEGEVYANYSTVTSSDIGSVYGFTRYYVTLSRERGIASLRTSPDKNGLKSWRRKQMGKEENSLFERLASLSEDDRHLRICASLGRWQEVSGAPMPDVGSNMWIPWSYGIPFKISVDRLDRVMIPEMAIKGWGLCLGSRDGITQGRLAI